MFSLLTFKQENVGQKEEDRYEMGKKTFEKTVPGFIMRAEDCYGQNNIPATNYLFKVNDGNTRKSCEICSKLTTKTPEERQWRHSGVFIVNFEHISHLFLVLLLTLNR